MTKRYLISMPLTFTLIDVKKIRESILHIFGITWRIRILPTPLSYREVSYFKCLKSNSLRNILLGFVVLLTNTIANRNIIF